MEGSMHEPLNDVLRVIFEEMIEATRAPSTLLPVQLVCKRWKEISDGLLFRYLRFTDVPSLIACHRRFMWNAVQGRYPGHTTRAITLPWETEGNFSVVVDKILRYTPYLRSFHAWGIPLSCDALELLGQVSGASLREVDITIGSNGVEGALQIALLGRLNSLERLSIEVRGLGDVSDAELAESTTPPLDMPSLKQLTIRCRNNEPVLDFLSFLARGRFPSLNKLWLDLPYIGTPAMGRPVFETLGPFIKNIGHQISDLTLNLQRADEGTRLLYPLLSNVRKLTFPYGHPPHGLIPCLPRSVEELHFRVNILVREQARYLMECLDQLHSTPKARVPSLEIIRVTSTSDEPFLWWTLGNRNIALAGQLMSRAIWLSAMDIRVEDDEGRWVGLLPAPALVKDR